MHIYSLKINDRKLNHKRKPVIIRNPGKGHSVIIVSMFPLGKLPWKFGVPVEILDVRLYHSQSINPFPHHGNEVRGQRFREGSPRLP